MNDSIKHLDKPTSEHLKAQRLAVGTTSCFWTFLVIIENCQGLWKEHFYR